MAITDQELKKEEKLADILRSVKDMIDQPRQDYGLTGDDEYLEDEYFNEDILDLQNLVHPSSPKPTSSKQEQKSAREEIETISSQEKIDKTILSTANQEKIKQEFDKFAAQQDNNEPKSDILEDKIEHIMKPLIKEWLDKHLPSIVEKIIAKEIAKIRKS